MIARALGSVWVRGVITVAILAYLIGRIDMSAAGDALWSVDLRFLSMALALVVLDRAAMIGRWIILLRSSGHPISAKSAAWIHLVSSFVGSALPAGVGADAARAFTLSRRTAQTSEAVASVAMDRMAGVVSIATVGACGLALWSIQNPGTPAWLAWAAVGVMLVAMGAMLWSDRLVRWALPDHWQEAWAGSTIIRLADALAHYRRQPAALAAVFGVSLVVQLLRVLEAYVLGRGLGVEVGLVYYLVFMPVGLLALLLPVSVAGFGLPQGVIVWLLRPRGVPDPVSFALSTLIVLTGLFGTLPGAFLYARAKKR